MSGHETHQTEDREQYAPRPRWHDFVVPVCVALPIAFGAVWWIATEGAAVAYASEHINILEKDKAELFRQLAVISERDARIEAQLGFLIQQYQPKH